MILQILYSNTIIERKTKKTDKIKVMCNSANGKPCQISLIRENEYGTQELHHKISALLEFSAKDVDEVGLWYGRKIGSKEMSYEERTPLMIAALFWKQGCQCSWNRSCQC